MNVIFERFVYEIESIYTDGAGCVPKILEVRRYPPKPVDWLVLAAVLSGDAACGFIFFRRAMTASLCARQH